MGIPAGDVTRLRHTSRKMQSVIVHYQEIALKGRNRPWFVERLVSNIRAATADLSVVKVRALMGRIELQHTADDDWPEVRGFDKDLQRRMRVTAARFSDTPWRLANSRRHRCRSLSNPRTVSWFMSSSSSRI